MAEKVGVSSGAILMMKTWRNVSDEEYSESGWVVVALCAREE